MRGAYGLGPVDWLLHDTHNVRTRSQRTHKDTTYAQGHNVRTWTQKTQKPNEERCAHNLNTRCSNIAAF